MEQLKSLYRDELMAEYENILQFWMDKTIDDAHGGFFGEVDNYGNPLPEAAKGIVLNTRILWTFASAYNFLGKNAYLEVAHRAYRYITTHFWDKAHKGLFWSVTHKGEVLDGRKQIYAQGFGIYGFSEYFRATGNSESLDYAIQLFELIEQHSYDQQYGGYLEALSQNWTPLNDMRLSAKDANEPKSMNTHLHIIEPYTNLFRVWPNDRLRDAMHRLVRIFLDRIINQDTAHFNLFFDMEWRVKSSVISYGHDIEGAWLLCEAAEMLNDKGLIQEVESIAVRMTDVTIAEGLAPDRSLYYELDEKTGHIDKDRHWWVQAEAMVGFVNAFQITGNDAYLKQMDTMWNFIKDNHIDRKNGEWFLRIHNNGCSSESDPKAGFWKCPYHNSRALMETYMRLSKVSTAVAVK
ncbi:AGE family epimerase/isomerase [Alkaliflexus imshenetskii]|uniref:AGE family epimerase/isomerase n=1 Tax=Alkaliflexus imshenetskii TaxID=286730 RepID=UPI0005C77B6F|nr:AGE family epimerase/isomerase [Alkaliflexus imshenetskii]